ncbi:MAG TPA: hypothetical protein DCS54_03555 [Oribacterium sp.]|nr:hypothetical protein [Oribacterium sp.]
MINTGRVPEESYIVENLDRAIQEGWIRVVYQPVIRTLQEKVCELEALVRWDDPERGELLPEQFVPVLEQENLIDRLDRFVLRKACADCRFALNQKREVVPFSVNLSGKDFTAIDLYQFLEDLMKAYNLTPDLIGIEIQGRAIEEAPEIVKSTLEKLHANGHRIILDDFGSSVSCLSILKESSFELVKIDRSFLSDFSLRSRRILTSMIAMAKSLTMDTLAEGVETEEQEEFLRSAGCDKMQGYFLMKPMELGPLFAAMDEIGMQLESSSERQYYNEVYKVNVLRNHSVGDELNSSVLWDNFNRNSGLGIFWKDKQRRFVGANQKFMEYYGFSKEADFVGKTDEDMGWHVNPDPYRNDEYAVLREGRVTNNVAGHCIAHGSIRNILASKMPIYDNGRIIGLVGYFRDITEEHELQHKSLRAAETDSVTGLLNIRGFMTARLKYEDEFRLRGTDFTEIHLTIDNFEDFLLEYGHAFGEEILYAVGKKLNHVIGTHATLARSTGNKFIVMKQVVDAKEAEKLAGDVRRSIREVVNVNGFTCKLCPSVGHAQFSDYQTVDYLQKEAERRMREEWQQHQKKE